MNKIFDENFALPPVEESAEEDTCQSAPQQADIATF
jgi:hypothetical protein